MMEKNSCSCKGGAKLIFACSGAADVGNLADQAARKLNREGAGKMFCIVGVGGRVPGIMTTTQAAETILAIDGCPLQCVKASLEEAGIADYQHLKLWEHGYQKGQTEVTAERIAEVAAAGKKLLE